MGYNKNSHFLISHGFYGSEIWDGLSWVVLLQVSDVVAIRRRLELELWGLVRPFSLSLWSQGLSMWSSSMGWFGFP